MASCDLDKAIRESSLPCLAVNFILLYQVRKLMAQRSAVMASRGMVTTFLKE